LGQGLDLWLRVFQNRVTIKLSSDRCKMDVFLKATLIVNGILLVSIALLMETKNIQSAIAFKALPMFMGLSCLVSALYVFGVLG